ncbi:MAG: prepilin-type N-terminal cleavage/methylation domain-containing protein, partial [Bdellovibrionales bacterium]|nr:prepilin-type N-terminal cleavage/methylation domain-containing protein [Bdellovibrionales bacterium]
MTHPRSSGFSVVELLVALGLLSVLSAVAVPSFNVIRGSYERQTAEHQFALDLLRARAVASQYNARAIVQLAADGRSYTIGMDYSPYNVVPAADEVDFTRNITGGVSIGPIGALVFDA